MLTTGNHATYAGFDVALRNDGEIGFSGAQITADQTDVIFSIAVQVFGFTVKRQFRSVYAGAEMSKKLVTGITQKYRNIQRVDKMINDARREDLVSSDNVRIVVKKDRSGIHVVGSGKD